MSRDTICQNSEIEADEQNRPISIKEMESIRNNP